MAISPFSMMCVWFAGPAFFFDGQGAMLLLPFLPGCFLAPIVAPSSLILAILQSRAKRQALAVAFWLVFATTLMGFAFFRLVDMGIAWSQGKASGHWW